MMGFGETLAFGALMIGIVSVFGMLLDGYKARMRVREREIELRIAEATGAVAPKAEPEADRLEARLRVLERIATDKSSTLAAEIEDLRQPAN